MRKLLYVILAIAFLGACNNATKQSESTGEKDSVKKCSPLSVDSLLSVASENVGKEVTIWGTVDHVCKHGGKRVKMFSSCPSKSIHVEAGEGMGNFKAEIEGSNICVVGLVSESKMDLAYVEDYEAKVKKQIEVQAEEADMEHKKGVDHHAKLEKIQAWKTEIEASEKGYISTYYIEATNYHECTGDCKSDEKSCCANKHKVEKSDSGKCCPKSDKEVAASEGCKKTCEEKNGEAKPCVH